MHRVLWVQPLQMELHNVIFWKCFDSTFSLVHWQKKKKLGFYECILEMQFFSEECRQKRAWEWLDIFKELCSTASQKVGQMSAPWALSLSASGKSFGFNICSSVCNESDKLFYDCGKKGQERMWRRQITIHKIGGEGIILFELVKLFWNTPWIFISCL